MGRWAGEVSLGRGNGGLSMHVAVPQTCRGSHPIKPLLTWRQTIVAAAFVKLSLQTVPHLPLCSTSRRPEPMAAFWPLPMLRLRRSDATWAGARREAV